MSTNSSDTFCYHSMYNQKVDMNTLIITIYSNCFFRILLKLVCKSCVCKLCCQHLAIATKNIVIVAVHILCARACSGEMNLFICAKRGARVHFEDVNVCTRAR